MVLLYGDVYVMDMCRIWVWLYWFDYEEEGGYAVAAEPISATAEEGVMLYDGIASLYDGIIIEYIYYVLAVLIHASARVWFPKSTSI